MAPSFQHSIALSLVILSSFVNQFQCQIIGLKLQTSRMPIGGDSWATYYQTTGTQNKIWLLSPQRWSAAGLAYYTPDVISYDIDNHMFEVQLNISNSTPSMNGWAPRYSVALGDNIYFNGDTRAIDVYNINTGTTTNIHTTSILWSQSCLATDGRFLFFMGGERDSVSGSAFTAAYDTNTAIWYRGKDQLYYLRRFPCEVINGVIYTFGGIDGWSRDYISKLNVGSGENVISNYLNNSWEFAGTLLIARAYHNTAICDSLDSNLVYIIGGSHHSDDWKLIYRVLDIELYDISSGTTQLAPFKLNEGRRNPAVMCIDEHLYIFGSGASWEKSQLTQSPTNVPTREPSIEPTSKTDEPTNMQSLAPTNIPSLSPIKSTTLQPSNIPSLSPINNLFATKHTLLPSYSSTFFVTTRDRNYSVEKEPSSVDVEIVASSIIIAVASVAIVIFLYRLFKRREKASKNNNQMMEPGMIRNNDDAVNENNEVATANYVVNAERGEDDVSDKNEDDNNDDGEGGDECNNNDEGVQKTEGKKEQNSEDTTDLINNDEFIIGGDDEITQKKSTAN